ncbi:MAG: hypothetical protein V1802_02735 [Candidatus Aenigmatarchaeota archaeon]
MGLFGKLRNKIIGRKEQDFSSMRPDIVGEPFDAEPPEFTNNYPRRPPPGLEPPDFNERFEPSISPREGLSFEPQRTGEGNYEIMDRLRFIENQLAAIRSQTELINERLKNIESGTRRY